MAWQANSSAMRSTTRHCEEAGLLGRTAIAMHHGSASTAWSEGGSGVPREL